MCLGSHETPGAPPGPVGATSVEIVEASCLAPPYSLQEMVVHRATLSGETMLLPASSSPPPSIGRTRWELRRLTQVMTETGC